MPQYPSKRPIDWYLSNHVMFEPNTGCWWWIGTTNRAGYGKAGRNGAAHRFFFETLKEPIKEGMVVCHHCDNPSCVNPDHLFQGTQIDNNIDKIRKNRQAVGERTNSTHLTEELVRQLLEDVKTLSTREITKKYKVYKNTVYNIKRGFTWNHVTGLPRLTQKRKKYKHKSKPHKGQCLTSVNTSRSAKGVANSNCKLNETKVLEIRKRHASGENYNQLSSAFGVTPTHIMLIVKRKTWTHL